PPRRHPVHGYLPGAPRSGACRNRERSHRAERAAPGHQQLDRRLQGERDGPPHGRSGDQPVSRETELEVASVEERARVRYRLAVRIRAQALLVGLASVSGWPAPARAAGVPNFFARLERIEVAPYFAHLARVDFYLNLLTLQGALVPGVAPGDL